MTNSKHTGCRATRFSFDLPAKDLSAHMSNVWWHHRVAREFNEGCVQNVYQVSAPHVKHVSSCHNNPLSPDFSGKTQRREVGGLGSHSG